jgi:hypothetical protein
VASGWLSLLLALEVAPAGRAAADRDRPPCANPGDERKFNGQAFLLNLCLPNFYFHATTAYDILRHCGIELGKRDFMGTPVAL